MISNELTLLHAGVQLGNFDGQPVDAVLQRVCTHVERVGFVKKIPKNIFCLFTCNQSKNQKEMLMCQMSSPKHYIYCFHVPSH